MTVEEGFKKRLGTFPPSHSLLNMKEPPVSVQLLIFKITLSHGKVNVGNYKIMIQGFNTKCFHVKYAKCFRAEYE